MIRAENPNWNKMNHSVFAMRFATLLRVSDFSGVVLEPLQQVELAQQLVTTPGSRLQAVGIDVDPTSGYTAVASIVEAEDEAEALDTLAFELVKGMSDSAHEDPECIQLVEAHVEYEETVKATSPGTDPIEAIADSDYTVEIIPKSDLNDLGEQVLTDTTTIFYQARQEVIGRL